MHILLFRSLLVVALFVGSASAIEKHPNVLFIAIDDLNDWIGCLGGHPQTSTPNIDGLAARGTLFSNAHCAAPACNPSRVALMTGQAPWRSGVYLNAQPWRPVMPNATTIPQHFRASGYWAGGSGKIYHGAFPDPASWNQYYPSLKRQSPPGASAKNRPLNGIPKTAHFDWGPIDATIDEMSDYKVSEWVCDRLSEPSDRPQFLACGIFRPHLPWYVPAEFFQDGPSVEETQLPQVREDDLQDIPLAGKNMARPDGDHRKVQKHNQWHRAVQSYLASIRFADAMVGRVLQSLDASGRRDRTIVVLWTDHGWHLGEKQHWRKFALWERATRVPMIVCVPPNLSAALPAGTTPGSRCLRPVSLLDLYPTLSDLCGLDSPPGPLDGASLLPLLSDPKAQPQRAAITTHGKDNHAIRTSRWRYIRYSSGEEELYDAEEDPNEWTNLATDLAYRDVIAMLRKRLPKMSAEDAPRAKK